MSSRKARRSSILKTRNDGGSSGEINFAENVDFEAGATRNLTGLMKRRVSFSHTNQVKEFEKSNSSTEASLSKTTDFNQTRSGAHDMSISIHQAHGEVDENLPLEETGGGADMSFYSREDAAGMDITFAGADMSLYPHFQESMAVSEKERTRCLPDNYDMSVMTNKTVSLPGPGDDRSVYIHDMSVAVADDGEGPKYTEMSVYQRSQIAEKNGTFYISDHVDMSITGVGGGGEGAKFADMSVYHRRSSTPATDKTFVVPKLQPDMSVFVPAEKTQLADMSVFHRSTTVTTTKDSNCTVLPDNCDMSVDRADMSCYPREGSTKGADISCYPRETAVGGGADMSFYPRKSTGGDMSCYPRETTTAGMDMTFAGASKVADMSVYPRFQESMAVEKERERTQYLPDNYDMSIVVNKTVTAPEAQSATGKRGRAKQNKSKNDKSLAVTDGEGQKCTDMSIHQRSHISAADTKNGTFYLSEDMDMSILGGAAGGQDMSVYQPLSTTVKDKTFTASSKRDMSIFVPAEKTHLGDMSVFHPSSVSSDKESNCTRLPDGCDMSVYPRETPTVGGGADMSFYPRKSTGGDMSCYPRETTTAGMDITFAGASKVADMSVYPRFQENVAMEKERTQYLPDNYDMSIVANKTVTAPEAQSATGKRDRAKQNKSKNDKSLAVTDGEGQKFTDMSIYQRSEDLEMSTVGGAAGGQDMSVYQPLSTTMKDKTFRASSKPDMSIFVPAEKTQLGDMSIFHPSSVSRGKGGNCTRLPDGFDMSVYQPPPQIASPSPPPEAPAPVPAAVSIKVGYVSEPVPPSHPIMPPPVRQGTTKLFFGKHDPTKFRDVLGFTSAGGNKRRQEMMEEGPPKIAFGPFGSAKTPKRNRFPDGPDAGRVIMRKPTVTSEVQTSPMLNNVAPATPEKHTREIGLDCTIAMHDLEKQFVDSMTNTTPLPLLKPVALMENTQEPPKITVEPKSGVAHAHQPPQKKILVESTAKAAHQPPQSKIVVESTAKVAHQPPQSKIVVESTAKVAHQPPQSKIVVESTAKATHQPPQNKIAVEPDQIQQNEKVSGQNPVEMPNTLESAKDMMPKPKPRKTMAHTNVSTQMKSNAVLPPVASENRVVSKTPPLISHADKEDTEEEEISPPTSTSEGELFSTPPETEEKSVFSSPIPKVVALQQTLSSTGSSSPEIIPQTPGTFVASPPAKIQQHAKIPEPSSAASVVVDIKKLGDDKEPSQKKVVSSIELEGRLDSGNNQPQQQRRPQFNSTFCAASEFSPEVFLPSPTDSPSHISKSKVEGITKLPAKPTVQQSPASLRVQQKEKRPDAENVVISKVSLEVSNASPTIIPATPCSTTFVASASPKPQPKTTTATTTTDMDIENGDEELENQMPPPTTADHSPDTSILNNSLRNMSVSTTEAHNRPSTSRVSAYNVSAETMRTTITETANFTRNGLDETSFQRRTNKTMEADAVLVDETLWETTRVIPQIDHKNNKLQQTYSNGTFFFDVTSQVSDEEMEMSAAVKPNDNAGLSADFVELRDQLLENAAKGMSVTEKMTYIFKIFDRLARLSETEWNKMLAIEQIKNYLGTMLKALETRRSTYQDPDPIWQAHLRRQKAREEGKLPPLRRYNDNDME